MGTMQSRPWLSAAALVAIALAVGLSRWSSLAARPQPHPIPASAAGVRVDPDPRVSAAAIPRVNLDALVTFNRAAVPGQRSPRAAPVDDPAADHARAAAVPEPAPPIAST